MRHSSYKTKTFSEVKGWRLSNPSKSNITSPISVREPFKVSSFAELHSSPKYPNCNLEPGYLPPILCRTSDRSKTMKHLSPTFQFDTLQDNLIYRSTENKHKKKSKLSSISTCTKDDEASYQISYNSRASIDLNREVENLNFNIKRKSDETQDNEEKSKRKKDRNANCATVIGNFSAALNRDLKGKIETGVFVKDGGVKEKKEKEGYRKSLVGSKSNEEIMKVSGNDKVYQEEWWDREDNIGEKAERKIYSRKDDKNKEGKKFGMGISKGFGRLGLDFERLERVGNDGRGIEEDDYVIENEKVECGLGHQVGDDSEKSIQQSENTEFRIIIHPDPSSNENNCSIRSPSIQYQQNSISSLIENPSLRVKPRKPHPEFTPKSPFATNKVPTSDPAKYSNHLPISEPDKLSYFCSPFPKPSTSPSFSYPTFKPTSTISQNSSIDSSPTTASSSKTISKKNSEFQLTTINEEPHLTEIHSKEARTKYRRKTGIKLSPNNDKIKKPKKDFELLSPPPNVFELKPFSRPGSRLSEENSTHDNKSSPRTSSLLKPKSPFAQIPSPGKSKKRGSVRPAPLKRTSTQLIRVDTYKKKLKINEIQRRNTLISNISPVKDQSPTKAKHSVDRFVHNFSIFMMSQLTVILVDYKGNLQSLHEDLDRSQEVSDTCKTSQIIAQHRRTIEKNMINQVNTAFKYFRKSKTLMTPDVIIQSVTKGLFSQGMKAELTSIIRANKKQDSWNKLKNSMVLIIKKRLNRRKSNNGSNSSIDINESDNENPRESDNENSCESGSEDISQEPQPALESLIRNFNKRNLTKLIDSTYSSENKQQIKQFSMDDLNSLSDAESEPASYQVNDFEINEDLIKIKTQSKPGQGFYFSSQVNHSIIDKHNPEGLNPDWNHEVEEKADMENMYRTILKQRFFETLRLDDDINLIPGQQLLILESDEQNPVQSHEEEIKKILKQVRNKRYFKTRPNSFVGRKVNRTFSNLVRLQNK